MKRLIRRLTVCAFCAAQSVHASGIVEIADGDCAALAAGIASNSARPSLLVLARNGHYGACTLDIAGTATIDGAGAQMSLQQLRSNDGVGTAAQVNVHAGATLTLHHLNLHGFIPAQDSAAATPKFLSTYFPAISNAGTLVLDEVSISDGTYGANGIVDVGGGLIGNAGTVIMRNSTITQNELDRDPFPLLNGDIEVFHSTIANNSLTGTSVFGNGTVTLTNSIVVTTSGTLCRSDSAEPLHVISRGGNVTSDASCGLNAPNDKIADPHLADLGRHGGVVQNLALDYFSPAKGNGIAANCEASDARGHARNANACDSGAYEFGGGEGKLEQTGMSGLYFNPVNAGHYVSVQRLNGDNALVIWNTFDQNGVPAWLYGVGTVNGDSIHVAQAARNVGGKLLPGGNVTGSNAVSWGTLDVSLADCANASLSYTSADAAFGTGSTSLQRLALLGGVECQR